MTTDEMEAVSRKRFRIAMWAMGMLFVISLGANALSYKIVQQDALVAKNLSARNESQSKLDAQTAANACDDLRALAKLVSKWSAAAGNYPFHSCPSAPPEVAPVTQVPVNPSPADPKAPREHF